MIKRAARESGSILLKRAALRARVASRADRFSVSALRAIGNSGLIFSKARCARERIDSPKARGARERESGSIFLKRAARDREWRDREPRRTVTRESAASERVRESRT